MLRSCFDYHTTTSKRPDSLKLDVVKAFFDKKEKKSPFSEAAFTAHIQKMVNDNKVRLDADTLYND